MTNTKVNRVSLTARVKPSLKKALETESREHGQTTSNYVESILLTRGRAVSDEEPIMTLQQQLESLQLENTALKAELETHIPEDDLIQAQENANYRAQKYQTRIDELTEYIERLSDNQESLISTEAYDLLVFEKANLESDNQALQTQIYELNERLNRAIHNKQESEELQSKYLQLQETERFLRSNNDDLQAQVQKLSEEVNIIEQAFDEMAETNQELANIYEAKVKRLSTELKGVNSLGFDLDQLKLIEEENDELHDRVEVLEMQLIEQRQQHKIALQTSESQFEEEEAFDPAYVEALESSIADYKEMISSLEDRLTVAEDEVYLDFSSEQHSEFSEHLVKLHDIYEGHTDEELVLGALYCGVENERAFFRKLVGEYFRA